MKTFVLTFYLFSVVMLNAQTDTLELLTNSSSKEWFYTKSINNGLLWEDDSIFCLYRTKLVFKNTNEYDKISPCNFPQTILNESFSYYKDKVLLGGDTMQILSITSDSLKLHYFSYVTLSENGVITDTIGTTESYDTFSSVKPTSLKENDKLTLKIFPNPANNTLNIRGYKNATNIIITNILGSTTQNLRIDSELDISGLSSGVYFIKLIGANNEVVGMKKFIKQ